MIPKPLTGPPYFHWVVECTQASDHVKIEAVNGACILIGGLGAQKGAWHVYPPNIIERWLKITHHMKVRKAILKCKKFCDKLNEREKRAQYLGEEVCHS